MNGAEFFATWLAVVGDEFSHSETGHEFVANLNQVEKNYE
jgi:hypothetical protein